MIIITYTSHLT